jgi:hypothetical protein
LIAVDNLHGAFQIRKIYFYLFTVLQSLNEFLDSQLAVPVFVNFGEVLAQEYNLVFRNA